MSAEEEDLPQTGLVNKYAVYKIVYDGQGAQVEEPINEQVFVLKPRTDPAARRALLAYATQVLNEGRWKLANDIMDWLEQISSEEHIEERLRELNESRDLLPPTHPEGQHRPDNT